jgi:hypothetical protein
VFIDIIDALRCPNPHEESWLVASANVTDGRDIMEGVLGCPVCRAEFSIHGGLVEFTGLRASTTPSATSSDEQAMRLAAFLDLTNVRSFAILVGSWGSHARALHDLVDVPILLVNPPADVELGGGLSAVTCSAVMPVARRSAHAIALDAGVTPALVASALSAVRIGGRVVAPSTLQRPSEVTALVQDESIWVGEIATAAEGLVSLRRGGIP